jgi:hypothetical protein
MKKKIEKSNELKTKITKSFLGGKTYVIEFDKNFPIYFNKDNKFMLSAFIWGKDPEELQEEFLKFCKKYKSLYIWNNKLQEYEIVEMVIKKDKIFIKEEP